MPETIQGNGLWHVMLAEKDLINQAGLSPGDFEQDLGHFKYKNRPVIMSHTYGQHLVVSISGPEDEEVRELMDAFSTVVGYKPFCQYNLKLEGGQHSELLTFEWDRIDADGRFKELEEKANIADLVRV